MSFEDDTEQGDYAPQDVKGFHVEPPEMSTRARVDLLVLRLVHQPKAP